MAEARSAAFFRVDGTLVRPATLSGPAYMALNAAEVASRIARLGGVAASVGLRLAGAVGDGHLAHRLAWMGTRGMSEDRLVVLGEEYYARFVLPALKPVGLELLAAARRRGHRIVLISELLDVMVAPLERHLEADELLCNRVELRAGRSTGRLLEPIVGGPMSGQWARSWAAERRIDLGRSAGYGARGADGLLLSAVGDPCAVDPDARLRRLARDLDWPIVTS